MTPALRELCEKHARAADGGEAFFQEFAARQIAIFRGLGYRGAYLGGVICPGINLSLEALHQAAARLPRIGIGRPQSVIGRSTVPAMQSGMYWGYIGLIEGLLNRIKIEFGGPMRVVATGGLAPLFAEGTLNAGHQIGEPAALFPRKDQ